MAGDNEQQPIILKKVIVQGGGHHGGAWKVAYADFVTAMMAFFLLLWLLNVTTDEQRRGLADYFAPTVVSQSTSGAGGVLGGRTVAPEGARSSDKSMAAVVVELSPPKPPEGQEGDAEGSGKLNEKELLRKMAEREQDEFRKAEKQLRQAIQDVPELAALARNLVIDNTPEGLRIQLVDQEGKSMFASGGAEPLGHTRQLMEKVAEIVQRLPNQIAITGHTDALPFRTYNGYGNWELSSDRANASRRTLSEFGVDTSRFASVSGKADTEPLIPEEPTNPRNRRISIVMLRETPADGFGQPQSDVGPAPGIGPAPRN